MGGKDNSFVKRVLRETGAWLMIAAGIAGCVLPIIPGIPLLLGGLALLAVDRPWAARLLEKAKAKWADVWTKTKAKTNG